MWVVFRGASYLPPAPETPQTLRRKKRETEEKPSSLSPAQGQPRPLLPSGGHPALPAGGWRCLRTHLGRAQGRTRRRQPPHPLLTQHGEPPPGCYSLCRLGHIIRDGDGLVFCPPARRRPAQQLLLLRLLSLWGWALAGQPPGRRLGKGSGYLSAPPRTPQPWAIFSFFSPERKQEACRGCAAAPSLGLSRPRSAAGQGRSCRRHFPREP